VSAHYDKGMLKLSLAKKAEAKPKLIKVGTIRLCANVVKLPQHPSGAFNSKGLPT
jgi:hypothetical protein